MATIFLLSGQGSQYMQMGSELYENNQIFRAKIEYLDGLIADLVGYSLFQDFYNQKQHDPQALLKDPITSGLLITQVALSIFNILKQHDCYADKFVGSSLGVLIALACAGRLTEEDCIRQIIKQGTIFKQQCAPGNMVSVLAPSLLFEHHPVLSQLSDLAGCNFDRSFVIAAPLKNLPAISSILADVDVPFSSLPVSRAYHSRWIDPVKDAFLDCYRDVRFYSDGLPVICSSRGEELTRINGSTIWQAVRDPMDLLTTFKNLELEGTHEYVDIGPSGTLANIAKQNFAERSLSTSVPLMTPFKNSNENIACYLQRSRVKLTEKTVVLQ